MFQKIKLTFLMILVLGLSGLVLAGEEDEWDYHEQLPSVLPVVGAFGQFNEEDGAVGLKLGLSFTHTGLALMGIWHHRPFKKTLLQRVGPHTFYQLQETRGLVGVQIAKRIPMGAGFDLAVAGGMGYSYADYAGTSLEPETGATAVFEAGLLRHWGPLAISAGYMYINYPDVPQHRGTAGVYLWF